MGKAATKRDWVVGEGVGAGDGNGDWDGGIWRPGMAAITSSEMGLRLQQRQRPTTFHD
jgi:hypothetical protein